MPDTTVRVVAKELAPVRDLQGLRLMPDVSIGQVGACDVLVVPGGYGQQALMHDEEVLALIRMQVHTERLLFSVCTGALLCDAAGILIGRQVTTHWAVRRLLPYYALSLRMQGWSRMATSSAQLA
jgi:cyclohexyl-isocyanide hydratase